MINDKLLYIDSPVNMHTLLSVLLEVFIQRMCLQAHEKVLIVKQFLLVSTIGNVWRTVWRIRRLMFGIYVLKFES